MSDTSPPDTHHAQPISPDQLGAANSDLIPGWVFEAINGLLGRKRRFTLSEAADAIMDLAPEGFDRSNLFDLNYMDFEPAYRLAGWSVVFDKPGFCESYASTYTFKAAAKR